MKDNFDTLEIHKWHSYFIFFPTNFSKIRERLALRHNGEIDDNTRRLMSSVLHALYKNGLLSENIDIYGFIRLRAFILSNHNFIKPTQPFPKGEEKIEGGGGCAFTMKGTSPEEPIMLSCPEDLLSDVVERIIFYLIESRLNIPRYESWDVINIENRSINEVLFDVCTVHVRYFDIFGKITSQHLMKWFFKNTITEH